MFRLTTPGLWLGLALGVCAALCPGRADAQSQRGFSIRFESLRIMDEDDPLSNDEPYLVVTQFKFRVAVSGGRLRLVPGSARVATALNGHNSLGRRKDNWADEDRTYRIPPVEVKDHVPASEAGWLVGAVVTHTEEDGFSKETARKIGDEQKKLVERAIRDLRLPADPARELSEALIKDITARLLRSLKRLDVGGAVRGLISAVDPDDYGGTQVVVGGIAPGGRYTSSACRRRNCRPSSGR